MAQVKMEKTNNFFVVTDVASSALVFKPLPTKDIRYELRNESVFLYNTITGLELKHRTGYMAGLTGTVNLDAGAGGTVDGISVDGVEIMSGATGTAQMASVLANAFSEGTVTLASAVATLASTGTVTLATALANVFATGTVTLSTALANVFGTGTITVATPTDNAFATGTVTAATVLENTFSTGTVTAATVLENTFSTGTVTLASVLGVIAATGTITCATAIANDTATVNGLVYTGVNGGKAGDFTKFSVDTSNGDTAIDLADSITQDSRSGTTGDVTAAAVGAVVTCTTDETGTAGNAITLVSSDGATLAVSGSGTFTGGIDADFCTINGLQYTAVAGTKSDNTEFTRSGTDISDATDLVDSINNDVRAGTLGIVSATNAGGSTAVITLTSDELGTGGDATTLTTDDAGTLAISGAVFTGGVDADFCTINGLVYTAVAGSKAGDFTKFSTDTGNNETATDLADSITNDVRAGTSGDTTAISASAIVTITTDVAGTGGDAITLTSSDGGTLAVSGAVFSGGVDADFCTINGLVYTAVAGAKADNTEFSTDTSNDATATDLALSVTNDGRSGTLGDCTANATTDTVTITTNVKGTGGDATTLTSSDGGTLAVSGATFSGGAGHDVTVNGLVYSAVSGAKADNTEFSTDTSDDATATDLALSITNDARAGTSGDQVAVAVTDTVTITTDVAGTAGNAITLVSNDGGTLAVSGAGTLTGGVSADTVTINGLVYTSVEGIKSDNTEFSIDSNDIVDANDLVASINADGRVGTAGDVSATNVGGSSAVITLTSDEIGAAGNAVTLVSSDGSTLAVSGAGTFTGGITKDSVTVNGLQYDAVAGVKANNTQFSIDGNDIVDATDLVASVNADTRSGTLGDVSATNVAGTSAVVTFTSNQTGTDGDPTTLVSSDGATLAVSGATFSGGIDEYSVTVNGLKYTAVDGTKSDYTEYSADGTDTISAVSLAHSVNNDTRAGTSGDITATNIAGVITFVTDVAGTGGDAITLASSDDAGTLTISGATFSGGVAADTITINGNVYTAISGTPSAFITFSVDTGDDATANSLASAVNGDTRAGTYGDVSAEVTTDTVTLTQTLGGQAGNATTLVEGSAGARMTLSGSTFDGSVPYAVSRTATATVVAANITAYISVPNYTATASSELITIKIATPDIAVNGLTVASEVTTLTSTDVNMGVDCGDIVDNGGTEFASLALLLTFLRTNTGA